MGPPGPPRRAPSDWRKRDGAPELGALDPDCGGAAAAGEVDHDEQHFLHAFDPDPGHGIAAESIDHLQPAARIDLARLQPVLQPVLQRQADKGTFVARAGPGIGAAVEIHPSRVPFSRARDRPITA